MYAVGWIAGKGRHDGGLATDHVRFDCVPDIVRAAYELSESSHLRFTVLQNIRSEVTKHVDVVIDDITCP